jgi:hypothetical protein
MQPNLLGSMRPLQFTVNAFPTHSQHFVSIPAIGPWLFQPATYAIVVANGSRYSLRERF